MEKFLVCGNLLKLGLFLNKEIKVHQEPIDQLASLVFFVKFLNPSLKINYSNTLQTIIYYQLTNMVSAQADLVPHNY